MNATAEPLSRRPRIARVLVWIIVAVVGLVLLAAAALAIFVATFDANRYKPTAIAWVKQHYDRTLDIRGPLGVTVFPRVGITVDGVSLSEKGRADRFADIQSAELALEFMPLLRGEARVGKVSAKGIQLKYTRDAQGRTNIDDLLTSGEPARPQGPQAPQGDSPGLSRIDIAAIQLQDVRLEVSDALARVRGTLTLNEFKTGRLAAGAESPVEAKLQAVLTEPAAQGELSLATRLRYEQAANGPLVLALKNTKASFNGKASSLPVKLSFAADAIDARLATGTGNAAPKLDIPKLELDAEAGGQGVKLTGKAGTADHKLVWDLAGQLRGAGIDGPMSTAGTYAVATGVVQARAQMAALDVDKLRASAAPGAQGASVGSAQGQSGASGASPTAPAKPADMPVDMSAAGALRGSVDASIGKLIANRITFTEVRVSLQGDGQTLRVKPFIAKVWGGQVKGEAQVVAAANRLSLQADAANIRIEQAMKDLANRDTVEGAGNVTLDVHTAGRSVNALKSVLGGSANVALRDGAVKGFNLAALGRQAKAALQMKKDDVQKAKATEKTDFSEITASFDIANGVARNKDLQAKSPYLRVTGEGAIDIGASRIDYTTFVTLTDTSKGQGGADLAALGGVRLPVRLTGPLDAMQYEVQWSAVASAAAKEALKGKVAEKLGAKDSADAREKLRDKAKDKLKGLFK